MKTKETKEAKETRTRAIIVKILQLLESENLTVRDSERILRIAIDTLSSVSVPVSVPDKIEWMKCLHLPNFTNPARLKK